MAEEIIDTYAHIQRTSSEIEEDAFVMRSTVACMVLLRDTEGALRSVHRDVSLEKRVSAGANWQYCAQAELERSPSVVIGQGGVEVNLAMNFGWQAFETRQVRPPDSLP